jgi:predicted RNase H-like HicB family nuclease
MIRGKGTGPIMKVYDLQVLIEQDEEGLFVAECPALQGCYAQGETFEKAIGNIKDVIVMCLQEMRQERRKIKGLSPEKLRGLL